MLRVTILTAALFVFLPAGQAAVAQTPVDDWSDRPDARAPAGVFGDALLPQGSHQFRVRTLALQRKELMVEDEEITPFQAFTFFPFDMVPLSLTSVVVSVEYQVGLADWLGLDVRVPGVYREAELLTRDQVLGEVSSMELGDVEARILLGLHNTWPFRAHLTLGAAFPTGSIDETGRLPDDPDTQRILPFALQPGGGSFVAIPGVTIAAENQHGVVGLQVEGRIPVDENDRGWTPGNEVRATAWMGYRFTDWVSGSWRVTWTRRGDVDGVDPDVDPFSSPLGHPFAQGGTELVAPVGINIHFVEGSLQGSRVSAELIIPAHHDLHGPQLRQRLGGTLSWSVTF